MSAHGGTQMITRWGANIDKDAVLQEYPRPQLRRDSYINLNGLWHYAITAGDGLPNELDGEILVPFSPECELSGVGRTVEPEDTLWYVKEFSLPKGFNIGRVLLHFGAVDQMAWVYLNGIEVGSHTGGYTPFSVDITAELREENQLVVKVKDVTDASWHTRGKQKTKKGGIWYTPQSGIWQTVWMESVPEEYITGLYIRPLYDEAAVELTVCSACSRPCTARMGLVVAQGETNRPFRMSVQGFTPWSPKEPHLYDFSVKMGDDTVESYFGMRKIELKEDQNGIKRLFLNGEPYFHNGVLDQGYWPDGLYTAPSDETMVNDIQTVKDLGFNMLRKHAKTEPLRWYYHCDRLGMLVWQDMPNGGEKYDPLTVTAPLFTGANMGDNRYARFARQSEEGREQFVRELDEMVSALYNCVCIAVWVPFNEGWGQFNAADIAARLHSIDPCRLVDHSSGWHDQGAGDIYSRHVYFKPYKFKADDKGRAAALTECGGYSLRIEGHSEKTREFGYKRLKNKEGLMAAYKKLYEQEIIPAIENGLCAAVYTQLSDVEGETNGLLTYDREVLKLPPEEITGINSRIAIALEPTEEEPEEANEDQGESED